MAPSASSPGTGAAAGSEHTAATCGGGGEEGRKKQAGRGETCRADSLKRPWATSLPAHLNHSVVELDASTWLLTNDVHCSASVRARGEALHVIMAAQSQLTTFWQLLAAGSNRLGRT